MKFFDRHGNLREVYCFNFQITYSHIKKLNCFDDSFYG